MCLNLLSDGNTKGFKKSVSVLRHFLLKFQNLAHFLTFLTPFAWNLWLYIATEYFLWLSMVFSASHIKYMHSVTILRNYFFQFFLNEMCPSCQLVLRMICDIQYVCCITFILRILKLHCFNMTSSPSNFYHHHNMNK